MDEYLSKMETATDSQSDCDDGKENCRGRVFTR